MLHRFIASSSFTSKLSTQLKANNWVIQPQYLAVDPRSFKTVMPTVSNTQSDTRPRGAGGYGLDTHVSPSGKQPATALGPKRKTNAMAHTRSQPQSVHRSPVSENQREFSRNQIAVKIRPHAKSVPQPHMFANVHSQWLRPSSLWMCVIMLIMIWLVNFRAGSSNMSQHPEQWDSHPQHRLNDQQRFHHQKSPPNYGSEFGRYS